VTSSCSLCFRRRVGCVSLSAPCIPAHVCAPSSCVSAAECITPELLWVLQGRDLEQEVWRLRDEVKKNNELYYTQGGNVIT